MNEVKCAYCFSTQVTIIKSDQTREVMTVQCIDCGKQSDIDVESFIVDPDDLPPE